MTAKDQFAAHVGLDWADKKHDVCVQFKNGDRIFHVIEHTPEALDIWLNELHQRAKGRIAIAVELKKGPVVYAGVVCGRGRNPTLRLWPTIFSGKIDVFPGDRRSRLISSMTSVAPA